MIQATPYMQQQMAPNYSNQPVPYQQQVAQSTSTQSAPNHYYNYPVASCYQPVAPVANGKSQYNGVCIEINNPQGVGTFPGVGYPYGPIVQEPQQPVQGPQQPGVQGPQQPGVQGPQQPEVQTPPEPVITTPETKQTTTPVSTPPVQEPAVETPTAPDTSVTPESFAARLRSDNLDEQDAAINEIATLIKENEKVAPILLDIQIFDSLLEVINKDTTNLEGPTPEVIELRNKPQEELTEAEYIKSQTPTPLDKAEINKANSIYAIAYMINKLNASLESNVEFKDLPCIETIINEAKGNPNREVRTAAVASLAYIAKPEYKPYLQKIFELAVQDEDQKVSDAATEALNSLNQI